MSELPRRIVSRLRRFIGNRRHSKRVRARLSFTLSLSDPRVSSNGARRLPTLDGHTMDVSSTGLALLVPAIRIGGHYLAGADRRLHVKLELPSGPVEMKVATVRYESLEDDTGYLIGARILEMSDTDRASFEKYVSTVLHKNPSTDYAESV
jgi:PilZ domain